MVQNFPYANQSSLYVSGLLITYVTTTSISIGAGLARDSTNTIDILVGGQNYNGVSITPPLTITPIVGVTTINGALGLDTGTFAASSGYYIHLIAASSGLFPTSALISLSATAPTLPFGYDAFRMIGWVRTLATAIFAPFDNVGTGQDIYFQYRTPIIMTAGVATAATTVGLLDTTGAVLSVPANNLKRVNLQVIYTPTTAANILSLSGFQTGVTITAANGQVIQTGYVSGQAQSVNAELYCGNSAGVPSINYIIGTAGTQTTHINGYLMSL